jgi:hypothetical protein
VEAYGHSTPNKAGELSERRWVSRLSSTAGMFQAASIRRAGGTTHQIFYNGREAIRLLRKKLKSTKEEEGGDVVI